MVANFTSSGNTDNSFSTFNYQTDKTKYETISDLQPQYQLDLTPFNYYQTKKSFPTSNIELESGLRGIFEKASKCNHHISLFRKQN